VVWFPPAAPHGPLGKATVPRSASRWDSGHPHDLATKLLRQTGNLKLVQHALGHASINTTVKYAHVLKAEVAAALEQVQQVPKKVPNGEQQQHQPIGRKMLFGT
jgi:integrase